MKKFKFILSLLIILVLSLYVIFFYDKNKGSSVVKERFVVGLDDTFAPMGFRDQNGEIVGFDVDLAREVGKRLNLSVVFQPCVWSSVFLELKGKNIDAIWNGVSINPARKKQALFSKPYITNRMVIVVAERSKDKILKKSDLKGKKVAVQSGSPAYDYVKSYSGKDFNSAALKELVQYPDNYTALLDLAYGGVDAVVMDEIVADYYVAKKKNGLLKIADDFAKEKYGIAFRKEDVVLRDKVQRVLDEMKRDGTAKKISQKWFGRDVFSGVSK